jgi:hypothetical protein
MQRFPPPSPLRSPDRLSADACPPDIEALVDENRRLRDVVIYLSTLVVKNVVERK